MIKSGQVAVLSAKGRPSALEVSRLGPGQIIGEKLMVSGPYRESYTYLCMTDAEVVPVKGTMVQQQVDAGSQFVKVALRGIIERGQNIQKQYMELLSERDNRPCPDDHVAHTFGSIAIFSKLRGKEVKVTKVEKVELPAGIEVDYMAMKQFCQRVMTLSPTRLEQAVKLLTKLELAYMHYEVVDDPKVKAANAKKSPEDQEELPKELRKVIVRDLAAVEKFYDFFQAVFFKSQNTEALKVDGKLTAFVAQLVKAGEAAAPDRSGIVKLDFKKLMEGIQAVLGASSVDYFTLLESRGLFAKRETLPTGTQLSFFVAEFKDALVHWAILKEIEKWNVKGSVEMEEEKKEAAPSSSDVACAACKEPLKPQNKFCPNCGAAAAKAA